MDYHEFDPRPEDVAGGYQTHSFLPSFPSGQADAGMDQGGLFMEQPIERMEEEEEDEVLLIGSNLATHRAPPRHKRAKMIQDEEEVNIVDARSFALSIKKRQAPTKEDVLFTMPSGSDGSLRVGGLVINFTQKDMDVFVNDRALLTDECVIFGLHQLCEGFKPRVQNDFVCFDMTVLTKLQSMRPGQSLETPLLPLHRKRDYELVHRTFMRRTGFLGLFAKREVAFLFYESTHYSLVILCNPGSLMDDSERKGSEARCRDRTQTAFEQPSPWPQHWRLRALELASQSN